MNENMESKICSTSFDETSMGIFLAELGHKMPVFCKSLNNVDDEILSYLQFTDTNENLSNLPIEEVLSPFLLLLVCEKIFKEQVLVDHLQPQLDPSKRSFDSIYVFYSQVLKDFDSLLAIITDFRDKVEASLSSDTLSILEKKAQNDLTRLHRRTIHIIEDLSSLVSCHPFIYFFTPLKHALQHPYKNLM